MEKLKNRIEVYAKKMERISSSKELYWWSEECLYFVKMDLIIPLMYENGWVELRKFWNKMRNFKVTEAMKKMFFKNVNIEMLVCVVIYGSYSEE